MSLDTFNKQLPIPSGEATELFRQQDHAVYWLGFNEDTVFRCNTYLIVDGDEAIVVDPGGKGTLPIVRERIEQILPIDKVRALIISHQDPDIAGCLQEWLQMNPTLTLITSPRTFVLLPHYGIGDLNLYDIEESPAFAFASGREVRFYPAPFLHSPMAFVSLDLVSGFMFTSDIFAAIDSHWQLVVDDFSSHADKMDLFHVEYMASNRAARGFVETIQDLPIKAFLPQHGSIIPGQFVQPAMDYLRNLQCGLDLSYPHL